MHCIQKIVLLSVIGFLSCKGKDTNQPTSEKEEKLQLSNVILTDLKGSPVNPDQYNGKTVFINFWATWCRPCLEEMPSIKKAIEILRDKNIEFLFASNETIEQIGKFKANHDYLFNYVRVENLEELNVMALPTTSIFNPEGKRVFSEMGYRKWDDKENIDLILNNAK